MSTLSQHSSAAQQGVVSVVRESSSSSRSLEQTSRPPLLVPPLWSVCCSHHACRCGASGRLRRWCREQLRGLCPPAALAVARGAAHNAPPRQRRAARARAPPRARPSGLRSTTCACWCRTTHPPRRRALAASVDSPITTDSHQAQAAEEEKSTPGSGSADGASSPPEVDRFIAARPPCARPTPLFHTA